MLNKRKLCNLLFISKASFALFISLAGIGLQIYFIYKEFVPPIPRSKPIFIPPIGSADSPNCFHDINGKARLEPPENKFLFGFSLDWERDTPQNLRDRLLGRPLPITNTFIKLNQTDYEEHIIEWQAQLMQDQGGMLEITLMPKIKCAEIPDEILQKFAIFMRKVNSYYGVPVLLRFMHEMNGSWMEYGFQPKDFKSKFITLAKMIRHQTNLTGSRFVLIMIAMVWSPNSGFGYPFGGYAQKGSEDFKLLDTNNDGYLSVDDDPYTPFYPGDEYVDWIGISIYNYFRHTGTTFQTAAVPDLVFWKPDGVATLRSSKHWINFYDRFVVNKGKPFILSETGSAFQWNDPTSRPLIKNDEKVPLVDQEVRIKQSWWKSIFSSSILDEKDTKLHNLRAAIWFEEMKPETSYDRDDQGYVQVIRDYRITFNNSVKNAFVKDLDDLKDKIIYAGKLKWDCRGQWAVNEGK